MLESFSRIGGRWVELPVMGSWRDYFELAQFQKQLPGGGSS